MGLETADGEQLLHGGAQHPEFRNTLNSFTQKQKSGTVKLEPRVHSAIFSGLRGGSPCRIRVLRVSLAAVAAAGARGGAPLILCGGGVSHGGSSKKKMVKFKLDSTSGFHTFTAWYGHTQEV